MTLDTYLFKHFLKCPLKEPVATLKRIHEPQSTVLCPTFANGLYFGSWLCFRFRIFMLMVELIVVSFY